MSDFWTAHLTETARHLVRMSEAPGFDDHARHRRDELLADQTYTGLREEIQRVRAEGKEVAHG